MPNNYKNIDYIIGYWTGSEDSQVSGLVLLLFLNVLT